MNQDEIVVDAEAISDTEQKSGIDALMHMAAVMGSLDVLGRKHHILRPKVKVQYCKKMHEEPKKKRKMASKSRSINRRK